MMVGTEAEMEGEQSKRDFADDDFDVKPEPKRVKIETSTSTATSTTTDGTPTSTATDGDDTLTEEASQPQSRTKGRQSPQLLPLQEQRDHAKLHTPFRS